MMVLTAQQTEAIMSGEKKERKGVVMAGVSHNFLGQEEHFLVYDILEKEFLGRSS
jgi:hypothetical protein